MRIIFITLVLFLTLLINLHAQWEILNEGFKWGVGTIDFVNEDVGWIAGYYGTLLKTTNGGDNWTSIQINDNLWIRKIEFINESLGWAIDLASYIWKTTDGGKTWVENFLNDGWDATLYAIDENNIYSAASGKIFKTTNGGISWTDVSPNLLDRSYNSLWFQNSQTGVVTGYSGDFSIRRAIILKTTNGGITWDETIVDEYRNIYDLQFVDNSIGYFRADNDSINFLCKTEDLFSSWAVKTQHPYSINSYQFLDTNIAYAIMGDSITSNNIMKTIDGGTTWQKVQSLGSYGILLQSIKIYFSKPNVGFILGKFIVQSVILKNFGGGDYWTIQKYVNYHFTDVHFLDENRGFLLGFSYDIECTHCYREGSISYTSNGGTSWEIKFNTPGILTSCLFVNEHIGMVNNGSILKSIDAGNIWMKVWDNVDSLGYRFRGNDISFEDEEKGWFVGRYASESNGAGILKSINTGETWHLAWQFPDTDNYKYELKSVHFTETSGWSVGDAGLIVKYTPQNGWIKQTSVTDLPLNKVFFSDDDHGWITGGYQNYNTNAFQNIFLKTTNGGDSWITIPEIPYLFRDIEFLDNNFGWAIGYDSSGVGGILKSTDGGNTWTIDTGNLNSELNSLFIKDNYGWAVGIDGMILRTTNAGPTWVNDNNQTLPTEFLLEQNYPNPFNPTTKIKYSIPNVTLSLSKSEVNVTMKVYDVLGREVTTLVNEVKPPGVYEVEFSAKGGSASGGNACNLSSGIYLYRLQTGDFNAVKKMLLLK